jgi:beta-lactamase regulating signal transducer with metallopeptidase domain
MTLAVIVYGLALGALLAGAAFFLDRGLRALGRPGRWVWLVAMVATVGIPLTSPLWSRTLGPESQGAISLPAGLLYEALLSGAQGQTAPSTLGALTNQPVTALWIMSSLLVGLLVFWTSLRLRRLARRWERKAVGTDYVLVSDGLGPAVLGMLRPTIVLPPWALELGDDKLEMILLHEKEHQAARDPAVLLAGLLLAALSPWNPALWWMVRRLRLAVEVDCDRRVLARGVPPHQYGNLLLEVASGSRSLSALAPALAEGGNTFLERRLLMIRSAVREHRFGAAALAVLGSVGLLILACETPTPPTIQEEAAVELNVEPAAADLAGADDGYFLVRKTGEVVDLIGPVAEDRLDVVQEGAEDKAFGVLVEIADGYTEAVPFGEADHGEVVMVREVEPTGSISLTSRSDPDGPKPLIIIDGVIIDDPDALDNMDPDNIERVEVMKGTKARELYGERGAGGVIQIFTTG